MALIHVFRGGCIVAIAAAVIAGCQVKPPVPAAAMAPEPPRPVNPAQIPADSPAHLCSADARLYLQFDDLAKWRSARQNDPLVEYLWQGIADIRPKGMWDEAGRTLGMNEDALTDLYFGQCLAIIGESSSTNTPYVIVSRAEPSDLKRLPGVMPLKSAALVERDGAKPFATFTSQDDKLLFAIHDRWLIVAPVKNKEHFKRAVAYAAGRVTGPEVSKIPWLSWLVVGSAKPQAAGGAKPQAAAAIPTLVDDEDFQTLVTKLPRERTLLLYTRDRNRKSSHAAAVSMDGPKLVAQYAGHIDKLDELYEQFDHGNGVDFGFMPASAITAASLNLVKKDAKGLGALNLFLFPKNVKEHVLPKLAAPMVVFLGRIDGDKIKPNPGVGVPAFGVAIRMSDPSVLGDLNRIVGGVHLMANVGQLNILEGVFGGKTIKADGLEYRIANFGSALTKQIKDPETKKMFDLPDTAGLTSLTYGRIGQWFVVCSQEALYKECAAAHASREMQLASTQVYRSFPFEMKEGLVMSALTRAPELAALTRELSAYWAKVESRAKKEVAGGKPKPAAPSGQGLPGEEVEADGGGKRIRQPMEWIANAIKHRDSFYIQIWRDGDGHLRGTLGTVPSPAAPAASTTE